MTFLRAFGEFWYDFIIGDDWKIAAAVVVVLAIGVAGVTGGVQAALLAPLLGVLFGAGFVVTMAIDTRKK